MFKEKNANDFYKSMFFHLKIHNYKSLTIWNFFFANHFTEHLFNIF